MESTLSLHFLLPLSLLSQLLPPMPDAILAFVIGELEKRQIIFCLGGLIRFTNENVRWQHNPSFLAWIASASLLPLDDCPLGFCCCLSL